MPNLPPHKYVHLRMSSRIRRPKPTIETFAHAFLFPALEFGAAFLFAWMNSIPWLPGRLGSSPLAATLISSTLLIFLLGCLSLRLRRTRWSSVGLRSPHSWKRTLIIGIGGGIAYYYCSVHFINPLIVRFSGPFNLGGFASIKGHPATFLEFLCLAWVYGALFEELAYRGYLMNRLANVFGETTITWSLSLLLVTLLFGFAHSSQGLSGMIATGMTGLVFGSIYLLDARNLWTPIVLHGTLDTVIFVRMFQGRFPGI